MSWNGIGRIILHKILVLKGFFQETIKLLFL